MPDSIKITVNGRSTAHHQAERATMHIRVSSEGDSQSQVAQNVTGTSQQLQQMLRDLADGQEGKNAPSDVQLSEWTMSGLSTWSYQPWTAKDEPPMARVYTANTTFEATFQDFKELGKIASAMIEKPHVSIDRVVWDVAPETRASLGKTTRVGAVKDAVAKAEDYAMAIGRSQVEPFDISDYQSPADGLHSYPMRMRTAGPVEEQVLNLMPEKISVESSVTVRFTVVNSGRGLGNYRF